MPPRILLLSALLLAQPLLAQSPADHYHAARTTYLKHGDDFYYDGSPEALSALRTAWSSIADYLIALRTSNPTVSVATLNHDLCLFTAEPSTNGGVAQTPEERCTPTAGFSSSLVDLGAGLLLIAPQMGEIGTVMVLGRGSQGLTKLWSIDQSPKSSLDPKDLIGAWQPEHHGRACKPKSNDWGVCGALYASVGLLPPDSKSNPRFYVDAGYTQGAGATIGSQTSIWRWNGTTAVLEWIDLHPTMIDDSQATTFHDGILSVASKGEFHTFFDCGECDNRPMQHNVLIEATRIQDLGTHSLAPELDAIDTLLWHLSRGRSTAQLASPQAVHVLAPQVKAQGPKSYNLGGMIESVLVQHTPNGAKVCLDADGFDTQLNFTLRRTRDGGYSVQSVHSSTGPFSPCSNPSYL